MHTLLVLLCGLAVAMAKGSFLKHLEKIKYDKYAPPNKGVLIEHNLRINRVIDLDLETQILTLDTWVMHLWNDSRLESIAEEETHPMSAPIELLWTPDILLENSVDGYEPLEEVDLVLYKSGKVAYIPRYKIKAYCPVKGDIVANSRVTCTLIYSSWTNNEEVVNLKPTLKTLYLSKDVNFNPKWRLLETSDATVDRHYKQYGTFAFVKYTIELERTDVL